MQTKLDKAFKIIVDISNRKVTIPQAISWYVTDENIAHLNCQVIDEVEDSIIDIQSYKLSMRVLTPNRILKEVNYTLSDTTNNIFTLTLPDELITEKGRHQCELSIEYLGDKLTSEPFNYNIIQSIANQLDSTISKDSHYPLVLELEDKLKEWNNILDEQVSKVIILDNDVRNAENTRQANEAQRIADEAIRAEFYDSFSSQLEHIKNTVRYSELGSIEQLKYAIEVDKQTVNIDLDVNLDTKISFTDCGIFTSNDSTINFTNSDAELIFNQHSFNNGVHLRAVSLEKTTPMMTIKLGEDSTDWKMVCKFTNFRIDGNKNQDGIYLISEKANEGVFMVACSNISINNCIDGIKMEVIETDDEHGWINGNTFTDITILNCDRNVVGIANGAIGRSKLTGNMFKLVIEPGSDVCFFDEGNNIYDLSVFDVHSLKTVEKNKFGLIKGTIASMNDYISPVMNTEQLVLNSNEIFEIGNFVKTDEQNIFLRLKFLLSNRNVTHTKEIGEIFMFPPGDFENNKESEWTCSYSNQALMDILTVFTVYEAYTDTVRVFLKSSETMCFLINERRFFNVNYAPISFTESEVLSISPKEALKVYEESFGDNIIEKIIDNNQICIRYSDGKQVCYMNSEDLILNTIVEPNGKSGLLSLNINFLKEFKSKPSVNIGGRLSKSDGALTYVNFDNSSQTKTSAGCISFINSSNYNIDRVLDFSMIAIGEWK